MHSGRTFRNTRLTYSVLLIIQKDHSGPLIINDTYNMNYIDEVEFFYPGTTKESYQAPVDNYSRAEVKQKLFQLYKAVFE